MRVYFLAGAEADLTELRRYLLQNFGETVWRDSYQKIKEAVSRLQTAPESSFIPDELAKLHLHQYRQTMSGMNRIVYETRGDVLYVHLICDARRDMQTLLSHRLLRRD